jgi:hypothetical protein
MRDLPIDLAPRWFSLSVEEPPKHREVYHDHEDCPEGKKIKPEHRENGTNGKPRCKECIKLG